MCQLITRRLDTGIDISCTSRSLIEQVEIRLATAGLISLRWRYTVANVPTRVHCLKL